MEEEQPRYNEESYLKGIRDYQWCGNIERQIKQLRDKYPNDKDLEKRLDLGIGLFSTLKLELLNGKHDLFERDMVLALGWIRMLKGMRPDLFGQTL